MSSSAEHFEYDNAIVQRFMIATAVWGLVAFLIGLIIVLPLLGTQFGVDLGFVSHAITMATNAVIRVILQVTRA